MWRHCSYFHTSNILLWTHAKKKKIKHEITWVFFLKQICLEFFFLNLWINACSPIPFHKWYIRYNCPFLSSTKSTGLKKKKEEAIKILIFLNSYQQSYWNEKNSLPQESLMTLKAQSLCPDSYSARKTKSPGKENYAFFISYKIPIKNLQALFDENKRFGAFWSLISIIQTFFLF